MDDNNLSSVGHTMDEAKPLLISETEAALNWIGANEMIANPLMLKVDSSKSIGMV